jgi:hypothetical protein
MQNDSRRNVNGYELRANVALRSGKVKVPQRGSRGIALLFLDLDARKGCVVNTMRRPLYPRESPGTHCTGGWVRRRAGLDGCGESRLPPGFKPVASRYTD